MPTPFVLTQEESLLWNSIHRSFRTRQGEQNVVLTDAFIQSAKNNLTRLDFKRDYKQQLPLLLVFLKNYPQYIEGMLPLLYKADSKNEKVRRFMNEVHGHDPQQLGNMLPQLFAAEKSLALQIPLLMDMGQYLDKKVFETLDFKLLLKASPDKIIKACNPTPATWDAFMNLANGLVQNEATKGIAQSIACSVGLQVATFKLKDAKSAGIVQYDFLDTAVFWHKHGWEWEVGQTVELMQSRAKGESLVSDMLYSVANTGMPQSGKALEAVRWLHDKALPTVPGEGARLDAGVICIYQNASNRETQEACLTWLNTRREHGNGLQYAWNYMPPKDMARATQALVDEVLAPMGVTKASLLSRAALDDRLPGFLAQCGSRTYSLLNHSALPLGDMDGAMQTILQTWSRTFPKTQPRQGDHDYRKHAMEAMLETIAHDLQEPARQALQGSNAFKQLMLYCAYLKALNQKEWSQYSFNFMPDLRELPLALLCDVYPEHQEAWAKVQQSVLTGTFDQDLTLQLVAKVLFNQDLTMTDIQNTCAVLGCPPETLFCGLQSKGADAFIPESFDFSEKAPS